MSSVSSPPLDYWRNASNGSSSDTHCDQPQTFAEASAFAACYVYFARQNPVWSSLGVLLVLAIVGCNATLVALILRNKITLFDRITIGHCLVDGLTGLLDVPLFYAMNVFGYWPFGNALGLAWASYDNNINTNTNLHMCYMTYTMLRSVQAPQTFRGERLLRRPCWVMLSFWCVGLLVWTPVVNVYGLLPYTNSVDMAPYYMPALLYALFWLDILLVTLVTGMRFIYLMHRRRSAILRFRARTREQPPSAVTDASVTLEMAESGDRGAAVPPPLPLQQLTRAAAAVGSGSGSGSGRVGSSGVNRSIRRARSRLAVSSFTARSQLKFAIITFTFWIQWILPCVIGLVQPFCADCNTSVVTKFYWLTYTVCATDPIVLALFNKNINLFSPKK